MEKKTYLCLADIVKATGCARNVLALYVYDPESEEKPTPKREPGLRAERRGSNRWRIRRVDFEKWLTNFGLTAETAGDLRTETTEMRAARLEKARAARGPITEELRERLKESQRARRERESHGDADETVE